MRLVQRLRDRIKFELQIAELAEKLADNCFEAVWQLVGGQVVEMPAAEARGYVWARADRVLQLAVADAAGRPHDRLYSLTLTAVQQRVSRHSETLREYHSRRVAA